ncbi:hypothetical protein KM915_10325 [Cytobacillus oceanisediminis]|uniref:hypothetical protein n=1 Tax=Cytobacillus oceanisediminis TaxID=665099 RepID=UPI001C24DFE5|nr:hypothetical protein [Cytobacillus oceanisediminis]MBU8730449.1 hypothetical protein [Cytobacillus oceanisediminis]
MEKQNLFMYRGKGNYGQHKVVSVEKHEADQLVSEGIATPVSFGKYDEYRQQVKVAHKKYTRLAIR